MQLLSAMDPYSLSKSRYHPNKKHYGGKGYPTNYWGRRGGGNHRHAAKAALARTLDNEYFPDIHRNAKYFEEWFFENQTAVEVDLEDELVKALGEDYEDILKEHLKVEEQLEKEKVVEMDEVESEADVTWDIVSELSEDNWEEVFLEV
jgi:hypothetical protein